MNGACIECQRGFARAHRRDLARAKFNRFAESFDALIAKRASAEASPIKGEPV
jgi:hypothetical protein